MSAPAVFGLDRIKIPVGDLSVSLKWFQHMLGAKHERALDHVSTDGVTFAAIVTIPGVAVPIELRWAPVAARGMRECDVLVLAVDDDDLAAHVRQQVSLSIFTDFENMTTFAPAPVHEPLVDALFTQLESWCRAMTSVRETTG